MILIPEKKNKQNNIIKNFKKKCRKAKKYDLIEWFKVLSVYIQINNNQSVEEMNFDTV